MAWRAPPRALTEADALLVLRDRLRARAKSDRAAGPLSEWGRGSAYTLDLVARYIDREPAAVSVLEGPDAADAAAIAASRGDVPPEVRPTCHGCWTGGEDLHARTEQCSGARPETPEMAVTTGEDAPARQCVAVLATNAAGEVLLVLSGKRDGRHHDRGWELPGGKLDPGEDPRDGARRETIEETGLAVVLSTDEPTVLPPSARHRGVLLFRGHAEGEPRPGSDAAGAGWWTPTEVLDLHARGLLSDLASRAVLLAWARANVDDAPVSDPLSDPLSDEGPTWARENASACNVDHSPNERPRVLGGECAECLHRGPLHEPSCSKARCAHVVADGDPVERCEGCGDPVSKCVCDEGRRARASEARTWSEEQIRAAWHRAQETGRPEHERLRSADDLATGWEHVRAALHGEAV